MPDTASTEEITQLRGLVPLQTLPDDALNELLAAARLQTVRKGKMLFQQGDTDHEHVYLLAGTVFLIADRVVVDTIDAGSDTARFPLAHQLPRRQSARAKTQVRIARIDSRLLSDALARTQTVDYKVADFEEASEDDWMGMLLQSRVLQQVPAANIQRVMINIEQVEVAEGEDLVRQGDPGDYYYMLTDGRAVVRRDDGDGKGPVELATLQPGDAFGEEALLSDSPRNSTVTMLQSGMVLRLSKEHFLDLIHNPLLERIDMAAGQARVDQGAIWLDLRSSAQYDEAHLPGAINFPFESLRYQTSSLAPDRHYVLYSNTGGRAMAGAFLLAERGFDVSVLEGGIRDSQVPGFTPAPATDTDSDHAVAVLDDAAAQARIEEAEQRARELEERLKAAEALKEGADAERQAQLLQVSQAVDQARRKLVETEEQKQEALAAEQKAYAEMERLTGSLEAVESERASLQDRMAEIEGLDKQLQARLAKAERELIGQRELAESATSSLEDMSEKLSTVLDQREQEREQHARALGELKEEMTALQMELEQAQLDLDELREDREERSGGIGAAAGEAPAAGQQNPDDREALAQAADALQAQLAALGGERDALQQRLDESQAREKATRAEGGERAAALEQALREEQDRSAAALGAVHAELDRAQNELRALREASQAGQSGSDETLAQLRAEAGELARRLEERELALAVARNEQAELIDALNAASSERESLELALNDRQHEQARLTDLENQVAEAQRVHENEMLAQEQVQRRLQDQLDAAAAEQQRLQSEVGRLENQLGEAATAAERLRGERDAARAELAARETEVEQLRRDVEKHAEQLRELQSGDEPVAELSALREELEAVREQAVHDVAQLREQLSQAETQKRRLQLADGREAISLEAMRQKIEALESSLSERQRELADAQESQQMLEDAMEDAHHQLDEAKRELERALVEADEAVSSRREAEKARDQLQAALYRVQEDADDGQVTDLRDARLSDNVEPIGLDNGSNRDRWLAALLGGGLVAVVLEALSLLSGRGELVFFLLNLGGP